MNHEKKTLIQVTCWLLIATIGLSSVSCTNVQTFSPEFLETIDEYDINLANDIRELSSDESFKGMVESFLLLQEASQMKANVLDSTTASSYADSLETGTFANLNREEQAKFWGLPAAKFDTLVHNFNVGKDSLTYFLNGNSFRISHKNEISEKAVAMLFSIDSRLQALLKRLSEVPLTDEYDRSKDCYASYDLQMMGLIGASMVTAGGCMAGTAGLGSLLCLTGANLVYSAGRSILRRQLVSCLMEASKPSSN